MGDQTSKRQQDSIKIDGECEETESKKKHLKIEVTGKSDMKKSIFENLCDDILLETFKYLRPVDLLYSFTGLFSRLDVLITPYTHTSDIRLVSKPYFHALCQTILPYFTKNVRTLRLSNIDTFGQISEILCKLNWSHVDQLESLTFDSITTDEVSRYLRIVHPTFQQLWRLSLTFDCDDRLAERLLIEHILTATEKSKSLTYCSIVGITFDLSQSKRETPNENLRELTLTIATATDFRFLSRLVPRLESLTCTIVDGGCCETLERIVQPWNFLTNLTLNIRKSIVFKQLEDLLLPHVHLKRLSLNANLHELVRDTSTQEIDGFRLEKFFRHFVQLTELHFYLRHSQTNMPSNNSKPDHLFLFSFSSYFWLNRSIRIATHFVERLRQRFFYTIPFIFDTFEIAGDVRQFFSGHDCGALSSVRHLSFFARALLSESICSTVLLKFFPNVRTITLCDDTCSMITANTLHAGYQWIQHKSAPKSVSSVSTGRVFKLNRRKSTRLYLQRLTSTNVEQWFANKSQNHTRQLTIYEMNEQQWPLLTSYFHSIHVLTLHVDTLELLIPSTNDLLSHLFTEMTSLFSLTVYYPTSKDDEKIRSSLVQQLLSYKKLFFIKCHDGVLNLWF